MRLAMKIGSINSRMFSSGARLNWILLLLPFQAISELEWQTRLVHFELARLIAARFISELRDESTEL